MTRVAQRAIQRVVVVDVTVSTLTRWNGVRTSQRESGAVVIKRRIQPRRSAVALFAGLWKIRGYVAGVCRSLVVLQVTSHAGAARQVVLVVDVAVRTLPRWHRVHPV